MPPALPAELSPRVKDGSICKVSNFDPLGFGCACYRVVGGASGEVHIGYPEAYDTNIV